MYLTSYRLPRCTRTSPGARPHELTGDELAKVSAMEFISGETISAVDMLDPLALTRYQSWAQAIRRERTGG